MKITTVLDKNNVIVENIDEVPVIALGFDIHFIGNFINSGTDDITIEDPDASQKITVQCKADKRQESSFLLHPSVVDITGEVTCLPVTKIRLKSNECKQITFSLYPVIMDQCFSPGIYQVTVSLDLLRSEPCFFAVSFRKESIPQLLQIIDDKSKDLWIRKEAFQWLKKVKTDFEYKFDEIDNVNNRENLAQYKSWWVEHKDSEQIDTLFNRLK